jgi:hypothetical protein
MISVLKTIQSTVVFDFFFTVFEALDFDRVVPDFVLDLVLESWLDFAFALISIPNTTMDCTVTDTPMANNLNSVRFFFTSRTLENTIL